MVIRNLKSNLKMKQRKIHKNQKKHLSIDLPTKGSSLNSNDLRHHMRVGFMNTTTPLIPKPADTFKGKKVVFLLKQNISPHFHANYHTKMPPHLPTFQTPQPKLHPLTNPDKNLRTWSQFKNQSSPSSKFPSRKTKIHTQKGQLFSSKAKRNVATHLNQRRPWHLESFEFSFLPLLIFSRKEASNVAREHPKVNRSGRTLNWPRAKTSLDYTDK